MSEHIMNSVFGSVPFVLICSVLTIAYRTMRGRERFLENKMVQTQLYQLSLIKNMFTRLFF